FVGSLFFFSCEDPVDNELSNRYVPSGEYGIPPQKPFPYVKRVIKQDFRNAKGWRIVWGGGEVDWGSDDVYKIPAIFSTITGAVNSIQYLNNTSPQNTDNADMWIYFSLNATSKISTLDYDNHTRKTRFKLSGMTVADLQDAAENNPGNFAFAYEWDLNEP